MSLEAMKEKFRNAGNEAAVLACVFKSPVLLYEVEQKLATEDFLTDKHRAIYTILQSLMRQEVSHLDTAAILIQAQALQLEKTIGGYDYINALFEKAIEPTNLNFYITRVSDAAAKFKIVQATESISRLAEENRVLTDTTLPAKDILDQAQQRLLQIAIDEERSTEAKHMGEGIAELLDEVVYHPEKCRGLQTGFASLDRAINGLEPGTLTVLGARPKTGKSAYLLGVAKHIAYDQGVPTLYVDTEMSIREQRFRLLSRLSQVPEREIKNGSFQNNEQYLDQVRYAKDVMEAGPLLHHYYPHFTPEGLASLIRKHYYRDKIGCVIFDYIKLPDSDLQNMRNVQEYQALGYLCVALKNLAGQLEIPVISAVQLNRRGANKGSVSSVDFADSDRILRYSNTLLGLSRKTSEELKQAEEKYGRDNVSKMGTHRLQILDTRAGGEDFSGIDIYFRQEVLTMEEAPLQTKDLKYGAEED